MSIIIIKPGVLDTIQDLGRTGQGMYGINPGGAMDQMAAKMANILTGNDLKEAVMEIHFPGPQILFEKDALISITGADFEPTLNKELLPSWQPVVVRKNTILQFSAKKHGARAYLSLHGGFCIDQWFNSYSTNLKAGAGGFQGRKLEKGDQLCVRESRYSFKDILKTERNFYLLPWRYNLQRIYTEPRVIDFMKGNEWNELSDRSNDDLICHPFMIHSSSDRMGYHLYGKPIFSDRQTELLSSAVSAGTMQLLPNGQLIVLMADHQTTGGYPRIGHVTSTCLPKLAQLGPGDTVQFKEVALSTAEESLFSQRQELQIVQRACLDHLNELYVKCRS